MNVLRIAAFSALILAAGAARAQQPQIPTLQVCNATSAHGEGGVKIASRADVGHSGTFRVRVSLTGLLYRHGGTRLPPHGQSQCRIHAAPEATSCND